MGIGTMDLHSFKSAFCGLDLGRGHKVSGKQNMLGLFPAGGAGIARW